MGTHSHDLIYTLEARISKYQLGGWGSTQFIERRKWQPTQVFLPGKSHGQRSLADYSPWGRTESDTTEHTHSVHNQVLSKYWVGVKGRYQSKGRN